MIKLSEQNIVDIYYQHIIKPISYYEKFAQINKYLSSEELEKYKNTDPPRLASIIDFKEWIAKHNIQHGQKLLYTCDKDIELSYINYESATYLPYPPYDLHNFDVSEKEHDLVIFNQTLEHLYNPFICVQNLYNHTKRGGFLYTTVPIINIPHMVPFHFWGITPMGLCVLMKSVGFEIIECGYWGSSQYLGYIFTNNDWPGYADISTNYNLGYNDICQAQTWILVKK